MKQITIEIEDELYDMFSKIGELAGGLPPERVASDALVRFMGGLSLVVSEELEKNKLKS